MPKFHVIFNADGDPAAIFPSPREGTEPVEAESAAWLAVRRRDAAGRWRQRPAPKERKPTKSEIDAAAEAAFQELLAERERAIAADLREEADPLFFKWQAGEGTEQDWRAKRQEIKARYPRPDRA